MPIFKSRWSAFIFGRTAVYNKKRPALLSWSFGPSGESRTHGLLNPIQARYQTALHPDSYCREFAHSNLFSITHVFTKVNSYLKFTAKLFSYCRAKL